MGACAVALPLLGQGLPPGPTPSGAGTAPPAWWRTRFPPAAIARAAPPALAGFDGTRVARDLICGNLDIVKLDDSGVYLFGWAYDPRTGAPAEAVIVLDGGRPVSPAAHVFRERPDVAVGTRNPRLATSGWVLWLPLRRVAPGRHLFTAYARLADGKLGRLVGEGSIERPGPG
ncbi:MAG TPA: hypothetical protein VFE33_28305 [Thermoanaerobaculia bacterium]|nr:hypothetical protein [Thermoanaerobaculia bacterium]